MLKFLLSFRLIVVLTLPVLTLQSLFPFRSSPIELIPRRTLFLLNNSLNNKLIEFDLKFITTHKDDFKEYKLCKVSKSKFSKCYQLTLQTDESNHILSPASPLALTSGLYQLVFALKNNRFRKIKSLKIRFLDTVHSESYQVTIRRYTIPLHPDEHHRIPQYHIDASSISTSNSGSSPLLYIDLMSCYSDSETNTFEMRNSEITLQDLVMSACYAIEIYHWKPVYGGYKKKKVIYRQYLQMNDEPQVNGQEKSDEKWIVRIPLLQDITIQTPIKNQIVTEESPSMSRVDDTPNDCSQYFSIDEPLEFPRRMIIALSELDKWLSGNSFSCALTSLSRPKSPDNQHAIEQGYKTGTLTRAYLIVPDHPLKWLPDETMLVLSQPKLLEKQITKTSIYLRIPIGSWIMIPGESGNFQLPTGSMIKFMDKTVDDDSNEMPLAHCRINQSDNQENNDIQSDEDDEDYCDDASIVKRPAFEKIYYEAFCFVLSAGKYFGAVQLPDDAGNTKDIHDLFIK